MAKTTTWGEWTDDFQAALAAWHQHGGAMHCDLTSEVTKWIAWDTEEIEEMTSEDDKPGDAKQCTVVALQAGGLTADEIAEEMEDWQG